MPTRSLNPLLFYGCWGLICLTAIPTFFTTFIGVFECKPVAKAWNPTLPGKCIDEETILVVVPLLRVVSEFLTLILPVQTIWSLHMSTRRKIAVTALFGTGSLYALRDLHRINANWHQCMRLQHRARGLYRKAFSKYRFHLLDCHRRRLEVRQQIELSAKAS